MNEDKPFIHLMKTLYGYYFFDVNTNSIMKISKSIYQYLSEKQTSISESQEHISDDVLLEIQDLENKGYLSSNKPKHIVHNLDKYLEYHLGNKLRKITLQLTQNCNFRCSYCIYSDADNDLQRKHSNRRMTIETAKKGIDYLIEHSRDFDDINIGFYGGEPLLEFDMIKECVLYAESAAEGKSLSFSITTNGSLLKPYIAEFFLNHNVAALISLDGPKEIQDRHRRFGIDGCGTFEEIEKNLHILQEKCPEFFNTLSFNVVIDPQDDLGCINDFFLNYDLFKETSVRGSIIDDTYSNEKTNFTDDYLIKSNYENFKMMLAMLGRINDNSIPVMVRRNFGGTIQKIGEKLGTMVKLSENMSHSGPCVPGTSRLFINVDGDFYPCERVSELSEVMKIGSLCEGYNIENIRALLNVGQITENECKNCWAITNCTICAKYADNIKNLSKELKLKRCGIVKNTFHNQLLDYITLKEIETEFRDFVDIRGGI